MPSRIRETPDVQDRSSVKILHKECQAAGLRKPETYPKHLVVSVNIPVPASVPSQPPPSRGRTDQHGTAPCMGREGKHNARVLRTYLGNQSDFNQSWRVSAKKSRNIRLICLKHKTEHDAVLNRSHSMIRLVLGRPDSSVKRCRSVFRTARITGRTDPWHGPRTLAFRTASPIRFLSLIAMRLISYVYEGDGKACALHDVSGTRRHRNDADEVEGLSRVFSPKV